MKISQSKIKLIKTGKKIGTAYYFRWKDYTDNFKPQKAKMTNKVLIEKPNSVVCWSSKSQF